MSFLLRFLLLLLLSFSSHSCNARNLGAVVYNDLTKDVENLKNHMRTLVTSKRVRTWMGGLQFRQHQPINANDRVASATSEDSSDSESLPRDTRTTRGLISGPSSVPNLRQTAYKLEEPGSRSRSVLGSESKVGHVATTSKETKESNESNVVEEEIGAMDYAQPHRKPPIHNELHW